MALGALLFALSPGLRLFVPAIASLLALLHLANAAKVAVLGAPIMPDDLAALRSLFLILDGWQRLGATAAVLLTVGLLLATLRPTSRGGRTALVVLAPAVLTLWLAPAAVAGTLDRWLGNRVWDQRHNFESRGLFLHLVQEGTRHLARRQSPPSREAVARALRSLQPSRAVDAGLVSEHGTPSRNVHLIVLESFWDAQLLGAAGRLSEDPMDPRFRLLWEAGGSSRALSPVFGGYTANAEFEVLCGFPMRDEAVVFETRLRRDAPCLPRHLAQAGYVTVASHPNVAAFWNRVHAYRRIFLGYEYGAYVESGLLAAERSEFTDEECRLRLGGAALRRRVAGADGAVWRSPGRQRPGPEVLMSERGTAQRWIPCWRSTGTTCRPTRSWRSSMATGRRGLTASGSRSARRTSARTA